MADWPTIASLATAGGTLVLAVATFSSVRSGQRSTRIAERSTGIAERALLIGIRPVPVPARGTDPPETVRFVDGRRVRVQGGKSWHIAVLQPRPDTRHPEPEEFRPQTLDLYVPAGDTGFWQGAVREPDDPFREGLH